MRKTARELFPVLFGGADEIARRMCGSPDEQSNYASEIRRGLEAVASLATEDDIKKLTGR
jgi:hypothetical protein